MSGRGALLRGVAFQAAIYALLGLMGILGAPVVLWSRGWTCAWARAYSRAVFRLAHAICGLRVEIRGTPPEGEAVVAAKHQSMLDVFILLAALPRPKFIMKRELVWVPVFGLYAMRIGSIPVDRSARGAGRRMLDALERGRQQPGQVVIYPQGTRVAPGAKVPFKRGAVRAYQRLGLPMVLAATNTGIVWPRRGWAIRPGTAVLAFGETLPPGLPPEEAARRMEDGIERDSTRLENEARAAPGEDRAPRTD